MHKKGLLVLREMKFCLFSDHGVNNNKISGVSAGVWKLNIYFKESIQKKILSSRHSKILQFYESQVGLCLKENVWS